ncbi:hypothetical protein B0H11DRAFT_1937700 [Mycena galericulata]|nr:hypothetical protein B0H11DRAFT_1937700 [Mycena galericulata]
MKLRCWMAPYLDFWIATFDFSPLSVCRKVIPVRKLDTDLRLSPLAHVSRVCYHALRSRFAGWILYAPLVPWHAASQLSRRVVHNSPPSVVGAGAELGPRAGGYARFSSGRRVTPAAEPATTGARVPGTPRSNRPAQESLSRKTFVTFRLGMRIPSGLWACRLVADALEVDVEQDERECECGLRGWGPSRKWGWGWGWGPGTGAYKQRARSEGGPCARGIDFRPHLFSAGHFRVHIRAFPSCHGRIALLKSLSLRACRPSAAASRPWSRLRVTPSPRIQSPARRQRFAHATVHRKLSRMACRTSIDRAWAVYSKTGDINRTREVLDAETAENAVTRAARASTVGHGAQAARETGEEDSGVLFGPRVGGIRADGKCTVDEVGAISNGDAAKAATGTLLLLPRNIFVTEAHPPRPLIAFIC